MISHTLKKIIPLLVWTMIAVSVAIILFSPKKTGSSDGRVVIEYAYPGLPHEKAVYRALIKEFERTHPNIKVKEIHPAAGLNILQKLQIQIAGGVPPDVCWLDIGTVYQFAKQGGLMPLDGFIEAENYDLSDFQPAVFFDGARCKGKLYGLPRELNCCLTFYNKDYFKQRGVPTPEELAAEGEWTWERFIEVGIKLTDQDKRTYSHNSDFHHPWLLSPIMDSYGVQLIDLKANRCNIDQQQSVEVLNMLKDFTFKHHIRPRIGEAEGKGDMFMSGQVAMAFVGRWMVPLYADIKDFEWGIAPFPAGSKGSRTPLCGAYHCIPKGARHPKEAWELVKFLSSVKGQEISSEMGLIIPVRKSVANSDSYLKYPHLSEHYNRMFTDEIYNNGVMLPVDEHWNQVGETVYKGLESAFYNRESIKNAVKRVRHNTEEVLRETD